MRIVLSLAAAGLLAVAVWQLWAGYYPGDPAPAVVVTPSNTQSVDPAPVAQPVDALIPPIDLGVFGPKSPLDPDVISGHGSHTGLVSLLDDFKPDPRASFHPHGQKVCSSGCAASSHPTEKLTRENFQQLLRRFAVEPMDETSLAFETLLYYGRQTRDMLAGQSSTGLDPLREELLRRELRRTHAKVSIRLVDEEGQVRASLPPTKVPLDRRHEFKMDVQRVQPLITSGTIKRVGLYHIWARL
ncbi:MAG: hypothetical protein IIA67_12560 [Planctomycetes bacterium]|nr:hypothetical protein [Planctomycetota bacterium]